MEQVCVTDPIGVKVSKPLTADQGSPFFLTSSWRLRAVMSTAKAGDGKVLLSARMLGPRVVAAAHSILLYGHPHWLGRCSFRLCRSLRQVPLGSSTRVNARVQPT